MKNIFIILVISYLSISVVQASPVSWDFQFFDDDGIQVGNGSFSYDPHTIDTFRYPESYNRNCPDPDDFDCYTIPNYATYQTNYFLTNVDFNILGDEWKNEGQSWWGGSANTFAFSFPNEYGFYTLPRVFALDSSSGHELLLSFNDRSPEGITATSGRWVEGSSSAGTWTAKVSAIPVPGAFLFLGSGLISLIMIGRKAS